MLTRSAELCFSTPTPSPQYDVHLPLLTVRETLAFARDALWASGTKNDLAPEFHQVLDAEASEVGGTVLVSCCRLQLPPCCFVSEPARTRLRGQCALTALRSRSETFKSATAQLPPSRSLSASRRHATRPSPIMAPSSPPAAARAAR